MSLPLLFHMAFLVGPGKLLSGGSCPGATSTPAEVLTIRGERSSCSRATPRRVNPSQSLCRGTSRTSRGVVAVGLVACLLAGGCSAVVRPSASISLQEAPSVVAKCLSKRLSAWGAGTGHSCRSFVYGGKPVPVATRENLWWVVREYSDVRRFDGDDVSAAGEVSRCEVVPVPYRSVGPFRKVYHGVNLITPLTCGLWGPTLWMFENGGSDFAGWNGLMLSAWTKTSLLSLAPMWFVGASWLIQLDEQDCIEAIELLKTAESAGTP